MRKIYSVIFILLAFILSVGCFSGYCQTFAFADKREECLSAKSKSAYLIDYETKNVLYQKNELDHLPIASMCKIMTLLLCFDGIKNEDITFDEKIAISENASGMGGSQVFLEANGEYMIGELIKSIVVASANDACVAMAEKLYGSQEVFVEKMNEKAKDLGMNDTVFVNCTGLPQAGQFSCAKDVSIMFSELLSHEEYFKFSKIWTDVVLHPNDRKTEISNTNKLIRFYQGCDSGKTGFTNEAGHCLTASALRNNMRLIAVVINAPSSKERFADVSNMFNYGFANYTIKKIVDDTKPLDIKIKVDGGKQDILEVVVEKPIFILTKKHEKKSFEFNFELKSKIIAPITKGDILGKLKIFENGIQIDSVNVLANEDIKQKTYFDIIQDIGSNWRLI